MQVVNDYITSPLSAQIIDFCDHGGYTENSNFWNINDSYLLDTSRSFHENNGSNTNTTSTTENNYCYNDDANNTDLSIMFDSQEYLEASIDFSSSLQFPVSEQFDFSTGRLPPDILFSASGNPLSQTVASSPAPPLLQSEVFEEDCLSSVQSYNVSLNPSSPSRGFFTRPGLSSESSGLFSRSMHIGPELKPHDPLMDYQADNGEIFCPITKKHISDTDTPRSGGEINGLDDRPFKKVEKLTVEQRKEKIRKYMKKRNERNYCKKIKYECRKTFADSRPRVKGRFARNDEIGKGKASSSYEEDDVEDDYVSNLGFVHIEGEIVIEIVDMESDQGKLFIGGISWDTDENTLREYFGNYGEVLQVTVMREKATGRPRGFGFVAFSDPEVIDRVLQDKHHIDNRDVDVKRAMSREEQNTFGRSGNFSSRNSDSIGNIKTKKIFVGGLPPTLSGEEFRSYFEAYGPVTDAVIMIDQNTQRPRGFGFISFESEDSVDEVLHKTFHDLNGKQVEVKRALPKDANPGAGSRGSGSNGPGGYPGYGGSGGGGYDGRMDSNRYMQPQNTGSGYPPYGASGYGTGYGYGSNGVGYGSYGGYGNPAGAPYGTPSVPGAGYGSGPRSSWGAQAPSSYGSVGYGNGAGWGGSGAGSVMPGQAGGPGGYGYGGYGGNDSSFANPSAYGSVGGRFGNMPNSHGSGYGDADISGGYRNHQGNGQAGYGGGYGNGKQALQQ